MEVDETLCGPLCQHPSCWSASKRLTRGLPHRATKHRPLTPPGDGLPTQSVCNLLDEYGPDPEDKYPTKQGGRPLHNQAPSDPGGRRHSRDSFLKLKTPMVTPASLMHASSIQISNNVPDPLPAPPTIHRVEVQEVFDLEDLRSEWQNTSKARQYYVWIPNPKGPPKVKQDPETSKSLPSGHLVDSTGSVVPRDVTELMVPRQVEWERSNAKVQLSQDDTYPVYRAYEPRIPQAWDAFPKADKKRLRSPKAPQQGHPYSRTSHSSKSPRENYYGIYELLDLPKDVLLKVLDHIDRRDMMDRERLAEALARAFPRLEHESSSLSMAYGDVLQQRKMLLRDLSSRAKRGGQMEPIPTKQVHLTEDFGRSAQGRKFQGLGIMPSPPPVQLPATPTASPVPRPPVRSDSREREGGRPQHREADRPRELPKKTPLPAIPVRANDDFCPERPKAASISLGMPELPSGIKVTKPFMYKNKNIDLTLGPVPHPPNHVAATPHAAASPRQPKAHRPDPAVQRLVDSPQSSERGSSTIHVTMPTVATEIPELPFTAPDLTRRDTSLSRSTSFPMYTAESTWDTPQTPLHAVSPSCSTHVPKTPAVTPATRLTNPHSQEGSPAATKGYRQVYGSPADPNHGAPMTSSHPAGITPEATGVLDTIQEHDDQGDPDMYRSKSDLPKSRRSVRFAPDVPPQPPSSPNQSERSLSPLEPRGRFVMGAESTMNNYSGASHAGDVETLRGQKEFTLSTESRGSQGAKLSSTTPNEPSPEPWPQVDEEAYKRTPSPDATTALTLSSLHGDPSLVGQYDPKSEVSGLTSLMASRESSFHSTKKSALQDIVAESPGPPPPSPEPKEGMKGSSLAEHSHSKLVESSVNLDDLIDTDSEITISAKPPSNLDDISRIHTPATPLYSEGHRENSNLSKPFLPTIFSEETSAQHEPADGESPDPESASNDQGLSGTSEQREEVSKAADQPLGVIPEHIPEPGQTMMTLPEITIIPGTRPASEQDEDSVTLPENSEEQKPDDPPEMTHPATPQIPAYPQVVDEDSSLHGDGLDLQNKMAQLDHFDTTEDMFKEELQEELDRLSSDGSAKKKEENVEKISAESAAVQANSADTESAEPGPTDTDNGTAVSAEDKPEQSPISKDDSQTPADLDIQEGDQASSDKVPQHEPFVSDGLEEEEEATRESSDDRQEKELEQAENDGNNIVEVDPTKDEEAEEGGQKDEDNS